MADDRTHGSRPAAASLFIAGVRVLDRGGGFTSPVDVSVLDGRVAAVGRGLRPAADQPRLDGQGFWLLPGVVDCHLHAGVASFDQLELLRTPLSRRVLETAHTLRRTLTAGVTFVRDAGATDAGVRDALAAGLVPGPDLQVSVVALGTTGGHGDGFLAGPGADCAVDYMLPDYPGRPPYLADGPAEFRAAVRKLVRSGADWIKILATGGVLSAGPDGDFAAELGEDEIRAAVAEAASRGRPVMVHALGGPAVRQAVRGRRAVDRARRLPHRGGRGAHGGTRLRAGAHPGDLRQAGPIGPGRPADRGPGGPRTRGGGAAGRGGGHRAGRGRADRARQRLRPSRRPRRTTWPRSPCCTGPG